MFKEYKGFYIESNFYGENEFSIQFEGDDIIFQTEEEAKQFIDSLDDAAEPEGENMFICINEWDMSPQFEGTLEECEAYAEEYFRLSGGVELPIWEAERFYDR